MQVEESDTRCQSDQIEHLIRDERILCLFWVEQYFSRIIVHDVYVLLGSPHPINDAQDAVKPTEGGEEYDRWSDETPLLVESTQPVELQGLVEL